MKKWVLLLLSAGLLWYLMVPQWYSLDRMAKRRFAALNKPGKEIVVGVCWPFEANQDGMKEGLTLAAEEINQKGLAGWRSIRLVFRDPGFGWERNKDIAMEFASTPDMSAVLGYYEDSAAIKASVLYETTSLLHIMVGVNSNAMTARGYQYIIRTVVSNSKIASALAGISKERGYQRIALVWEDDAYGTDLAYQYRVAMDVLNADIVYHSSYPLENTDFRLCINQLKEVNADVIFFAGLEPHAGDFLRHARELGLTTPVLGAFSNTPQMRKLAGNGLEGAMYFDFYNVDKATPENLAFVQAFQARFGHKPDAPAAQGYDALQVLAKAARFTGSRNPLDLSYAIRFMDPWEGANGRYQFDATGDIKEKPIYINVYKNGQPMAIHESHLLPPALTP